MIQRQEYLDKLIAFKDKQLIKVISGIRRCGKSTLFLLFQQYLLNNGVKEEQIISLNFEDPNNYNLLNYMDLYKYISSKINPKKKFYVFLDEIQNVENFEKAVDGLFIKENVDVYITGSNAYFLSGELATLLSGRYVEIKMLPLSFNEYLSAQSDKTDIERKFSKYLTNGGFPYVLKLDDDKRIIIDYLQGIYNTIILKDIVQRKKISDVAILESVVKFLFDNIGNNTSAKKISDTLTSSNRKTSSPTVENYLQALSDSFIIYKANRFDITGKQLLKTSEKYYVADLGLKQLLLATQKQNIGHNIENVVYLELLRRGYQVYVGKMDSYEVDFVAINNENIEYYQVAQTVMAEETLERELNSLNKIKDHNPKFLLTMDNVPTISHNGIKQINLIDWLLKKN